MQSYGLALRLRNDPEVIARYKKEHERAWPEVLARLREVGVREMKIYLLGDRLFMYCETVDGFDPRRDFARTLEDPAYRRWDELMRTMQQRVDEARPDEWWAAMELVFDLNWPQHARSGGRA
jgi:L-rhamnose mutarotase